MDKKLDILKSFWGYSSLRESQSKIVDAVLSQKDVLALLPTGGGKSICFQLPTMMNEGLCLVITPLIALMEDQVNQLQNRGIPAVSIHSGMSNRTIDILLDNCIYGKIKFLYVSPERIKTTIFKVRLSKMNVFLLAVDEAHCISKWGYDFRPAYLEINEIKKIKSDLQTIALTATATKPIQSDILEKLQMNNALVFNQSLVRNNLVYAVRKVENKPIKLIEVLKNIYGSAIVYVNTRKATVFYSQFINDYGIEAEYYHGGLGYHVRKLKQTKWTSGKTRVMVATNSFGMGVDKANVRLVVHLDLPKNIESYYQESGRAGRDNKKSYALIIYNERDIEQLKQQLNEKYPEVSFLKKIYQCLINYFSWKDINNDIITSYDFDINEFTSHFKLEKKMTYYGLLILMNQNFISLDQNFYSPSRLYFKLNTKDLYKFQIENVNYDNLIKAILRMYGGEIFNRFIKISESQIAKLIEEPFKMVIKKLNMMHKLDVLDYEPERDKPQLMFLENIYEKKNLSIDTKIIKSAKQKEWTEIEHFIRYLKNIEQCRMSQLVMYFDEKGFNACGICDVCISKKTNLKTHDIEEYQQKILSLIINDPLSIDELIFKVHPSDKKKFIESIRLMIEDGMILYNKNNQLIKKN